MKEQTGNSTAERVVIARRIGKEAMAQSTYGSMTTAKPMSIEEVKRTINEFMAMRAGLPVAIECQPSTEDAIRNACQQIFPSHAPADRMCGLPIERNLGLPHRSYVIRMADGAKTMHYPSGLRIRCPAE